MPVSHHHTVHHHLRHRHAVVAPKPVLVFDHGTATTLTWNVGGYLVTVDYPTAAKLCSLNTCEGAR